MKHTRLIISPHHHPSKLISTAIYFWFSPKNQIQHLNISVYVRRDNFLSRDYFVVAVGWLFLFSQVYFVFLFTVPRSRHSRGRRAVNNNDLIYMHFDLPPNVLNDSVSGLDEAYLAVHLVRRKRPKRRPRKPKAIRLHVYQMTESYDRVWLDTVHVNLTSFVNKHRRVRLNVFRAVNGWVQNTTQNHGLQIYCENCHTHFVYVVHEEPLDKRQHNVDFPTLRLAFNGRQREKRHRTFRPVIQDYTKNHVKCSKKNEKCCRRQLKVQFKELAGLDFVIQPKMFDAGYCEGTCPTAYNPAHEHAVLQGKLADLGKYNVPRPCCTPSILSDIDVLHVDEEDSSKLKVTTFKNMRVLQCACS